MSNEQKTFKLEIKDPLLVLKMKYSLNLISDSLLFKKTSHHDLIKTPVLRMKKNLGDAVFK